MRLDFCVACGERDPEALEHHHLVPRTAGGGDEDRNFITLCHGCHGRAHGYERADTRALTRKGLAAAKARGVRLGGGRGARLSDAQRAQGRAVLGARAHDRAADLAPVVAEIRAAGASSLASIAAGLNERNIPASRGGKWSPVQVMRVLKGIAA